VDRCPLCYAPTRFEGISIRPIWARWIGCTRCGTYVSTDEHGSPLVLTKKIPTEAYFVQFRERQ
jgi:hypothetical protein